MDAAIQEVDPMPPEKPTQIVPRPTGPVAVKTPRAMMLAQALEEEREQRDLLRRYVNDFLVKDQDFGEIPGTKRPSLLKPGAEKLMDLFRCRPEYEVMAKEVNHATGLYYYEIKCRAVSRETDTVLNEGVGSASSYESKYRYRNAGRKCPSCGAEAIKRSKYPPRNNPHATPGWYCHDKSGGCGGNFDHDDPAIVEQENGKVQNPDLADVANTVLKMAKKRAQVDCAIALARVSDMFTQDVEDLVDAAESLQRDAAPRRQSPPAAQQRPAATPTPAHVAALWKKTWDAFKDKAKPAWDEAAKKALGEGHKPSNHWTAEETASVERVLFDVPF